MGAVCGTVLLKGISVACCRPQNLFGARGLNFGLGGPIFMSGRYLRAGLIVGYRVSELLGGIFQAAINKKRKERKSVSIVVKLDFLQSAKSVPQIFSLSIYNGVEG